VVHYFISDHNATVKEY